MKRYEEYKDSGVEWIGEIPVNWESWKISHAFERIGSGTTPESGNPLYHENGTISWLNTGDLNDGELNACSKKITLKALEDYSSLKIYPKNSLVIAMYGATIGKTSILQFETTTNQACCVFSESDIINLNFLQYWFKGNKEQIINLAIGGGQPNISQDILKGIRLFCPKKEEQTQIANYLDYKTAQIDTLIEKKERLIALLEEERTALINEVVTGKKIWNGTEWTKPSETKDSGIEWLGEIPKGWIVTKLKFLGRIRYGLGQPPKQMDGGLPIIRATNIFRGKISDVNLIRVDPSDLPMNREPILRENDIIIVRSGAYTADSAIITKEWDGAVTGYDIVFTPKQVNAQLLAYSLLSTYLLDNQLLLHRLRAAQPHLNSEEIGNSFFLLPSKEEQEEMANRIKSGIIKIESLKRKMNSQISLLKEYKTALISEVVTGKIDVRDEVIPSNKALESVN